MTTRNAIMEHKASVVGKQYNISGDFSLIQAAQPIMNADGKLMGVTKPRGLVHLHSYGGEAPFFQALAESKRLLATRCDNPKCEYKGSVWLPFRIYCPDCLYKMTIVDLTEAANKDAKIHTYIKTSRTGAFNTLDTPIRFVDLDMPQMVTLFKSYMLGAKDPEIGLALKPIFRNEPTYTILDIAWVTEGEEAPAGFSFASTDPVKGADYEIL